MRRVLCTLLLMMFAVACVAGEVVRDRRTGEILFTPLQLAFDSEGHFRPALLPRDLPNRMADAMASPRNADTRSTTSRSETGACNVYFGEPDVSDEVPKTSASEATSNALAIYAGVVDLIEAGFVTPGNPGSLLSLGRIHPIKTNPDISTSHLRVFYPDAQFAANGVMYCARASGNPHRPEVGDRVIVFIYDAPPDSERSVVFGSSNDIVFEGSKGLSLPARMPFLREWKSESIRSIERNLRVQMEVPERGRR